MRKIFVLFALIFPCLQFIKAQEVLLKQNLGHPGNVYNIIISPDGKHILTADDFGSAILWDKQSKKELRNFFTLNSKIVDFAPQLKSIFTLYNENSLNQFSIETGKKLAEIEVSKNKISGLCIDEKNNSVIVGTEKGEIIIINITTKNITNKVSAKYQAKYQMNYAFNPVLHQVVAYTRDDYDLRDKIEIIDYQSGNLLYSISEKQDLYYLVTYSPDGKYLMLASIEKNDYSEKSSCIKIYNAVNGSFMTKIQIFDKDEKFFKISSLAINSFKNTLAYITNDRLYVVDINTQKMLYNHYCRQPNIVAFDEKENTVLYANNHDIFAIDIENGKNSCHYVSSSPFFQKAEISNNKKIIAIGTRNYIKLIDIEKGKQLFTINKSFDDILGIKFSTDNEKIAVFYKAFEDLKYAGLRLSIFNIKTNTLEKELMFNYPEAALQFAIDDAFERIILSYNKASLFDDKVIGIIRCLSIANGKELYSIDNLNGLPYSLVFAENDSKFIAFFQKSTSEYNSLTGEYVKNNLPVIHYANNKSFNFNSYIMSVGGSDIDKGFIYLWDYKTGKFIQNKFQALNQAINAFDLSSDNSLVTASLGYTASFFGKELNVGVWEVQSGLMKGILANANICKNVFFSENANLIYNVSTTGEISVWDTKTLKNIITFTNIGKDNWVTFTPDGKFDGSKDGISSLYFVKKTEVLPLENLYEQYYTPNLFERLLAGEQFKQSEIKISDLKPAPIVKVTNPIDNQTISTEQLAVNVEVTDAGGGIDEILLYHNGKLVETTNRGFKKEEQINDVRTQNFSISLTNGINSIKATAFNNQRTEAIPHEITINYSGQGISKANLYILVIGINQYQNTKYNLNYAIADATAFEEELRKGSAEIFEKINTFFIKDSEATKARIVEELNKLKTLIRQEDMLVFYYSGHGAMSVDEKPVYYLIPTDVTQMFSTPMLQQKALSANELKQFSTEIKAQKQMYILDACQSGGVEEVLAARGAAEEKAIAQLARSTGTYWLAASNSEQFATEFKDLQHGLFTYCILQALGGKADGQNDKKITVQELSSFLNDQVPVISKQHKGSEQYPVTYGFGMDFPIVIVKE